MDVDKIHFEQQERFLEYATNMKTIYSFCNLYGILGVEFSSEMLSLGKIALTKVSGIAQDGSVFNAPDNDLLPEPLEINHNPTSPIIALKIHINSSSNAEISLQNAFPNSKYISTQAIVNSKIHDDSEMGVMQEIQGDSKDIGYTYAEHKINLTLASLRLKLGFLGDKTPDEFEIPIGKISNITTNKQILLDDKFIPTSIDIGKNPFVRTFLEEMIYTTNQHKEVLTQIFMGIDQTKNTLDFSTYLSLNLLKKWNLIFSYIANKDKMHPEYLYEKLIEFQGDLLAIHTKEGLSDFIVYNHNDLTSTFIPLTNNLRVLFANITSPKYTMATIIDNGNGFFDCVFDNASILQDAEIYLAVASSAPMEFLLNNFKAQSKIHTQSGIKNIVTSQLKGLNIEPIPSIPSSLPHLSNYVYYRLDKKDTIFKSFAKERIISIYITNNIPSPDIKLWALF